MSSDNGGIIGVVNDPTSTVASGVWQQEEQYEAKVNGTWPQRTLFTTKSLRFDDGSSDYLTESVSSTSNRRTFTYSAWIKRSSLSGSGYPRLFNPFVNSANFFDIFFRNTDALNVYSQNADSNDMNLVTNRLFRDLSAWYHIVVAVDTTQGTDSNRVKLYVNGTQETSFSAATYPSQNTQFQVNLDTVSNIIGRNGAGSDNYFDGYMSEVIFIDGQALAPTSFGSTNSDGVWIPAIYTGTFGTNGFNLQFEDASSLGTDSSSNGNNFTVNNLTSIDQSTDYPEVNFATMNSLDNYFAGSTFSEGNLKIVTTSGNITYNTSTIGFSSGKWYMETKLSGSSGYTIGVVKGVATANDNGNKLGNRADGWSYDDGGDVEHNGGSLGGSFASYSSGNIIGIYVDLDNNKLYFSKDGSLQNSGTGLTLTAGTYFFALGDNNGSNSSTYEVNFGSPSFAISSGNTDDNGYGNFEYSPNITGDGAAKKFYALNTKNLGEFG